MIDLDNFSNFTLSNVNSIKDYWDNAINKHPLLNNIKDIDFKHGDFITKFRDSSYNFLADIPKEWFQAGDGENIEKMIAVSKRYSQYLSKRIKDIGS